MGRLTNIIRERNADYMKKILIASDIHGSAWYCRKLLQALEREGAKRMLLLGDILYPYDRYAPYNGIYQQYMFAC